MVHRWGRAVLFNLECFMGGGGGVVSFEMVHRWGRGVLLHLKWSMGGGGRCCFI